MKKLFKKGFTLVELLVVIAILAVLAGVSVIAYFGFTSQAQQSADQQAVTQMNVALKAQEAIEKPADVEEAKDVLEDAGFAVNDYVPLEKQNIFYYDEQSNRVLIFDQEESKVTFPQEMADKYSQTSEKVGYWFLLNDKTYIWNSFAPADPSDVTATSEELADAIQNLGETELIRLESDITVNENFAGERMTYETVNEGDDKNPNFVTYYHYYFPTNEAKDVHIDLNGHTLTFNYELNFGNYESSVTKLVAEKESFTFSNGKIVANTSTNLTSGKAPVDGGKPVSNPEIIVGENTNVTFNDCEYVFETSDADAEFNFFLVNDYGNLTLSNCSLDGSKGDTTGVLLYGLESETNIFDCTIVTTVYGITSNASKDLSWDLDAKVDNSSVTSLECPGVLLNVPGTYNFSNSTVEGFGSGAVIRGGDATFENCIITETGDNSSVINETGSAEFSKKAVDAYPFNLGQWGPGNMVQFGGLIVGDWAKAYDYDAACKLVNTEVHMDDAWTDLPIVYLSQDSGNTTAFDYDDACKFSKKTQTYTGEGQAYMVNSVAETTFADGSKLSRGTILVNGVAK